MQKLLANLQDITLIEWLIITVVIGIVSAIALGPSESRHKAALHKCAVAGYTQVLNEKDPVICSKQVNGTDQVLILSN